MIAEIRRKAELGMNAEGPVFTFVEKKVSYTLEMEGRVILIENVPARVCVETGEPFFSPQTVERLQEMIWEKRQPDRVVETPVYEFAA
jgi:YgiT-type zinc finger domain-containing protein